MPCEHGTEPQGSAGFYNRSITFVNNKEYDKALADLNEAIRLDQKLASAYLVRGEIWLRKKELDKAIADLNAALGLEPLSAAYDARGFAWASKTKYDKAIDDYNEAIRLDSATARSYYGRGCAWAAKKEFEKAVIDFDEAIPRRRTFLSGLRWPWPRMDGPEELRSGDRGLSTTPSDSIPLDRALGLDAVMLGRRRKSMRKPLPIIPKRSGWMPTMSALLTAVRGFGLLVGPEVS